MYNIVSKDICAIAVFVLLRFMRCGLRYCGIFDAICAFIAIMEVMYYGSYIFGRC